MVIYKITNLVNGKFYIGKDKYNKETYYGSGMIINQAIAKHGKENFKREIVEYCNSEDHMNEREVYWIDKLNARERGIGYNIHKGGTFGGDVFTNHPNRELYRKRISEAAKKTNARNREIHRKNSTELWKDPEYRTKVLENQKKTMSSDEYRKKRTKMMKEICNTPEQRAIRSKNASGTNNSNYKGPYYVLQGTILEEFTFKKEMTNKEWKSRIQ